MNMKRFLIAALVVFVILVAYEIVVHGVILSNMYKPYVPGPQLQRGTPMLFLSPDGAGRAFPFLFRVAIFAAELLFAFFFTYIFTRGVEGKGWLGEGIRYGVLVWGLAILPLNVGMYSWSQMPGKILMWWIIFGLIECLILGCVCAALYNFKKEAVAAG
ncbi:MAG: hypothetical protein LAO21_21455 [Acidobacteriia bacterium]|nr:hypothetical protein [Terriglobia bacterium]